MKEVNKDILKSFIISRDTIIETIEDYACFGYKITEIVLNASKWEKFCKLVSDRAYFSCNPRINDMVFYGVSINKDYKQVFPAVIIYQCQ